MRTLTPHITRAQHRLRIGAGNRLRILATVTAVLAALGCMLTGPAAGATAPGDRSRSNTTRTSYGWPIRPFDRQHPVRGFFGDPRIGETAGETSRSFHFGIDVSCPDGTPVYATLSGRVVLEPTAAETVSIVGADRRLTFSYWHVIPTVRNGQAAVAYRTVIGHVARGWAHVHFAELRDGLYVNPLRRSALQPYDDTTKPQLRNLRVERGDAVLSSTPSSGTFDLVVEAADTTPIAIAAPWRDKPVTPAVLRWRVRGQSSWRTAVDVRWTIPTNDRYDRFFATWTRQNNPWGRRGRYRFYLAHDLDAAMFPRGALAIEVQAVDTRGNATVRQFTLPAGARSSTTLVSATAAPTAVRATRH